MVCGWCGLAGNFRDSHIVAFLEKVMCGQGYAGVTSTGVSRLSKLFRPAMEYRNPDEEEFNTKRGDDLNRKSRV